MPHAEPTPLSFAPFLRPQIWGGNRLAQWGKPIEATDRIGESWELSVHPFHFSRVAAPAAQTHRTLGELWESEQDRFLGKTLPGPVPFPLLVKLLDCAEWLSIQVHPGDHHARKHAARAAESGAAPKDLTGKTEAWYVLHAEPDAEMIVGLHPGVTPDDIRSLDRDRGPGHEKHIDQMFVRERPQAGQFLLIKPGTVHAARGILVWEFQTPSDLTYRVYDWGRLGPDGKPRELHLDLAIDTIDWSAPRAEVLPSPFPAGPPAEGPLVVRLMAEPFQVEQLRIGAAGMVLPRGEMRVLCVSGGTVELRTGGLPPDLLAPGSLRLLPADLGELKIAPKGDSADLLLVTPRVAAGAASSAFSLGGPDRL